MSEETKKGLLRVGADFFGGPVDTAAMALQGMPRNLLPPTPIAQLIARAMGLPVGTVLPQGKENPSIIGSSEWIADKTGITGDSPEYQAARLAGNLGLMATPAVVNAIRNFKPRPGDLNMWVGPKAKDYDHDQAGYLNEVYKRWMGKRKQLPVSADVDRFNEMAMRKHKAIVEPASGQVLQFRPDTLDGVDPKALARLHLTGQKQTLNQLYPDPNLDQYPGLNATKVEKLNEPGTAANFEADYTLTTTKQPHRVGKIGLNTEQLANDQNKMLEKYPLEKAERLIEGGAARLIRHEVGHSLQRSENLPRGGNPALVEQVGRDYLLRKELTDSQRGFGLLPSPEQLLREKGYEAGALRAVNNPQAAYEALVGERLATSAEVHNQPWERVMQHGIPKFENSLVMHDGTLIPISQYLRGLQSPYTPAGVLTGDAAAQGLLSSTVPPFRKPPRP